MISFALLFALLALTGFLWYKKRKGMWAALTMTVVVLIIARFFHAAWWVYLTIIVLGVLVTLIKIREENGHGTKPLKFIAGGVVLVALIYGLLHINFSNPFRGPADVLNDETIKILVVDDVEKPCPENTKFNVAALRPVAKTERQTADAISTPLKLTKELGGMMDQIYATNCSDPLKAAASGAFFANLDPRLVKKNPWLAQFVGTGPNTVNEAVAKYLSGSGKNVKFNQTAWFETAGKLNTLESRFSTAGFAHGIPIKNYHLLGSVSKDNGLPAAGINDRNDPRDILMLRLPEVPTGDKCLAIGFALADMGNIGQYTC